MIDKKTEFELSMEHEEYIYSMGISEQIYFDDAYTVKEDDITIIVDSAKSDTSKQVINDYEIKISFVGDCCMA